MAKYLISFPSAAMVVPDGNLEPVARDAHAVIDEAKAAGGGSAVNGGDYVLLSPRGPAESGRYQSRALRLQEVEELNAHHRRCLGEDAQHQFWIGSADGRGALVYDEHGLIYAYGPLEKFEEALRERGLKPGAIQIPSPHSHHFQAAFDADVEGLLDHWEWKRSDLGPGDPQ